MVKNITRFITCSLFMLLPTMSYGMVGRVPQVAGRAPQLARIRTVRPPRVDLPPQQTLPPAPGQRPVTIETTTQIPLQPLQPGEMPLPSIGQHTGGSLGVGEYLQQEKAEKQAQEQLLMKILLQTGHVGSLIIEAVLSQSPDPQVIIAALNSDIQTARQMGLRFGFIHPTATATKNYLINKLAKGNSEQLKWKTIGSKNKPLLQFIILPDTSIILLEPSLNDFTPIAIKPPLGFFNIPGRLASSLLDPILNQLPPTDDTQGAAELANNIQQTKIKFDLELAQQKQEETEIADKEKKELPRYAQLIDKASELGVSPQTVAHYKKLLSDITESTGSTKDQVALRNKAFSDLETVVQGRTKLYAQLEEDANLILQAKQLGIIEEDTIQEYQKKLSEIKEGTAAREIVKSYMNDFAQLRKKIKSAETQKQQRLKEAVDIEYEAFEKELADIQKKENKIATIEQKLDETQQEINDAQLRFAQSKAQIEADAATQLKEMEEQHAQQLAKAKDELRRTQAFINLDKEQQEKAFQQIETNFKQEADRESEIKKKNIDIEKNKKLQEIEKTENQEIAQFEDELAKLEHEQAEAKARYELAKQQRTEQTKAELEKIEKEIIEEARLAQEKAQVEAAEKLQQILEETQLAAQKKPLAEQEQLAKKPSAGLPTKEPVETKAELPLAAEQARIQAQQQVQEAAKKVEMLKAEELKAIEEVAAKKAAEELAAKKEAEVQENAKKTAEAIELQKQKEQQLLEQQAELEKKQEELKQQATAKEKEKIDLEIAKQKEAQEVELAKKQEAIAKKEAEQRETELQHQKTQAEKEVAEKALLEAEIQKEAAAAEKKAAEQAQAKTEKAKEEARLEAERQAQLAAQKALEIPKEPITEKLEPFEGGDGQIREQEEQLPQQPGSQVPPIMPLQPMLPKLPKFPSPEHVKELIPESVPIEPLEEKVAEPDQAKPRTTTQPEPQQTRIKPTSPSQREQVQKPGVITPVTSFTYDLTKPATHAFPKIERGKPFTPTISHETYTPPSLPQPPFSGQPSRYSGEPYRSEELVFYPPVPEKKPIEQPSQKITKPRPEPKELREELPQKVTIDTTRQRTIGTTLGQYFKTMRQQLEKAKIKTVQAAKKAMKKMQEKEKISPVWTFITNIQTTIKNAIADVIDYIGTWFNFS